MIDDELDGAARLFKALSSSSRLAIIRCLSMSPLTVGGLVEATGQSQPLVSQHLRVLRDAGLVVVTRSGREGTYAIADQHVTHVIEDAIAHSLEDTPTTAVRPTDRRHEKETHHGRRTAS